MANQIAVNLSAGRDLDETARLTQEHLRKFWTRDMRTQLARYARESGDRLAPAVCRALADDDDLGDT
jgi:hypothetical protein